MSRHKIVILSMLALFLCCFVQSALAADLNFERERTKQILSIVSSEIQKNFYDKDMKRLDWKALTNEARVKIENAKTAGDMYTAIFSLVNKLDDSHTIFLPPGRVDKTLFGFNARAYGDEIRIYSVTRKGAAEEAGLKPGDRLISVNNFNADRKSFDTMMLYYKLLRPASQLQIEYARGNEPVKQVLLKAKIKAGKRIVDLTGFSSMNDVWDMVREEEDTAPVYRTAQLDEGIGYMRLPQFGMDNYQDVAGKLSNAKAVIVDLRGNGGGLVDGLRQLSGHFENAETTMADVVERKKTRPIKVKPQKPALSQKLVVLIDSGSASAAEMFARHFQREGKAIVVGDRSSGRVNEARIYPQQSGTEVVAFYAIEIATGNVVFPGGEELEKKGVIPDVTCLPDDRDFSGREDSCLVKAIELARKQIGLEPTVSDQTKSQVVALVEKLVKDRDKMEKE